LTTWPAPAAAFQPRSAELRHALDQAAGHALGVVRLAERNGAVQHGAQARVGDAVRRVVGGGVQTEAARPPVDRAGDMFIHEVAQVVGEVDQVADRVVDARHDHVRRLDRAARHVGDGGGRDHAGLHRLGRNRWHGLGRGAGLRRGVHLGVHGVQCLAVLVGGGHARLDVGRVAVFQVDVRRGLDGGNLLVGGLLLDVDRHVRRGGGLLDHGRRRDGGMGRSAGWGGGVRGLRQRVLQDGDSRLAARVVGRDFALERLACGRDVGFADLSGLEGLGGLGHRSVLLLAGG
jgi:hypothetical protein